MNYLLIKKFNKIQAINNNSHVFDLNIIIDGVNKIVRAHISNESNDDEYNIHIKFTNKTVFLNIFEEFDEYFYIRSIN